MLNGCSKVLLCFELEKQKELVGIPTSSFLDNIKKLKQTIS
ncbi:hypothetical protein B4080_5935 [Bacillus cereus]|nr:hypothetical protein B4080_5935 [Bacillus cereus]